MNFTFIVCSICTKKVMFSTWVNTLMCKFCLSHISLLIDSGFLVIHARSCTTSRTVLSILFSFLSFLACGGGRDDQVRFTKINVTLASMLTCSLFSSSPTQLANFSSPHVLVYITANAAVGSAYVLNSIVISRFMAQLQKFIRFVLFRFGY
jgi:hypothetical protein